MINANPSRSHLVRWSFPSARRSTICRGLLNQRVAGQQESWHCFDHTVSCWIASLGVGRGWDVDWVQQYLPISPCDEFTPLQRMMLVDALKEERYASLDPSRDRKAEEGMAMTSLRWTSLKPPISLSTKSALRRAQPVLIFAIQQYFKSILRQP